MENTRIHTAVFVNVLDAAGVFVCLLGCAGRLKESCSKDLDQASAMLLYRSWPSLDHFVVEAGPSRNLVGFVETVQSGRARWRRNE